MSAQDTELTAAWASIRCGFLTQEQPELIVVDADSQIVSACKTLADNGISSAPVFDSAKNSYLGMLEYADLVALVLAAKQRSHLPEGNESLENYISQGGQFQVAVRHAVDISERNPFYSLFPESTLLNAVQVFSSGAVRRIVVMSGDGKLHGIISQTTVLRFVHDHLLSQMDGIVRQTLEQLNIGSQPVVQLNGNAPVIDALELMHTHKFSSVALVESDGTISGNISLSDVKLLFRKRSLGLLSHSCRTYVATIRQEEIRHASPEHPEASTAKWPYWSVPVTATLHSVILKMVATRSHHIFVIDAHKRPIRIVSVGDVLRALTPRE
ncbi:hypothetical protein CAOG_07130 [Capsaspora owczarzaki ATCC 30864]|uniref:CBS domain-containing protein n=1 Tax=Capsaspora owczarzaki (strain ATCC 30864) TaxID=595528 RepID=A0A0D2VYQ7_CAPO3|nr:hypothetical protein CAOG_07130 [Capsaspora owczarzaki ATCC 30864]KJE96877.1 hypothetical protein CAOG_007130 [Capsaspora owczarzaki ATCC 30864]|eukprot:XP_004343854.1 hypothetical protein CAOG_07130 [Capsaspora owczarzaki ATCC 30864]